MSLSQRLFLTIAYCVGYHATKAKEAPRVAPVLSAILAQKHQNPISQTPALKYIRQMPLKKS